MRSRPAAPLQLRAHLPFPAQVNQQRQKLQELQTLIDRLSSGQDSVSDKAFEDRLQEAERAILELLEEAQSSKGEPACMLARQQCQTHLGVWTLQMWTELCWSGWTTSTTP